jgi:hypothetical protein
MKPIKAKPGLYAIFYERLKQIAYGYGFNLVVNGSMDRDLDLVLIQWTDNPGDIKTLLQDFEMYLTGMKTKNIILNKMPGGRLNYVINLNRGNKKGEWKRFADEQYYIDISITPITQNNE